MFVPFLFAAMMHMPMQGACAAGDLAIVSTKVLDSKVDANDVQHFSVAVTVTNMGRRQPGNTLESVVMYQQDDKTDTKGLQPLAAGASQTVVFHFKRNAETEKGSTNLRFAIDGGQPAWDCGMHHSAARLSV